MSDTARTPSPFPTGTILGYPRIGPNRELKRALEAHWAGRLSAAELEAAAAGLRASTRERLAGLGLGRDDSSIPESFAYYDQVLDAALAVGAVPERFARFAGGDEIGLDGEFALARGDGEDAPLELTKWFDTNYHYLVPEIGPGTAFRLASRRLVRHVAEAVEAGYRTRPVLVGPVTLLLLSKPADGSPAGFRPLDRLADVLPVYAELLAELAAAGAEWVQLDEPALVAEHEAPRADVLAAARTAYARLGAAPTRPALFVAAPYGDLGDALPVLLDTPVEAIGLDLVAGSVPEGPATDRVLVGGVVSGRNVWRGDLEAAFDKLDALAALSPNVAVATSTSLQHVPHDVAVETELPGRLRGWLAFADQKVAQVAALARGLAGGREAIRAELDAARAALADRADAPGVREPAVRDRIAALTAAHRIRTPFETRAAAQDAVLALPPLPTTTIGSFPQTAELRAARAALAAGRSSEAEYTAAMRAEIARVIELQEQLGFDVLVHGEPERNDMVQYFAELLDGFAVTRHGWVQSYGSRCTRPSILWGDVSRPAPMTLEWTTYAQSLTARPVKGLLTGPVTILAWSFVRDDQPLADTADQVALAVRDEIADLEAAGIRIVQVDEPALRELLPLQAARQADYLAWSVGAFRLATAGAADATQVHTHLCYSEFGAIIDAIDGLDADVTSIEAARSKMEVVGDLRASGFARGIGPGVYDIHSPRVPGQAELDALVGAAAAGIPAERLWINPDCGLKTRGYPEVEPALAGLVAAARAARTAGAARVAVG